MEMDNNVVISGGGGRVWVEVEEGAGAKVVKEKNKVKNELFKK